MLKQKQIQQIEDIVKDTLLKLSNRIRISKIDIKEDLDSDGDRILRINIIFDGSPRQLDTSSLTGTVRKLRPQLEEIEESAFPVLSFISKSDYESRAT